MISSGMKTSYHAGMRILGLHFGHDAAACVLADGIVDSYVSRERQVGVKHAIGLTDREVNLALHEAGISFDDIDACALVSTQNVEMLTGLIDGLDISLGPMPGDAAPSPLVDMFAARNIAVEQQLQFQLRDLFQHGQSEDSLQHQFYSRACPEVDRVARGEVHATGWLDNFVTMKQWLDGATLAQMGETDLTENLGSRTLRYGFHYPAMVSLHGRVVPGYLVHHHMAHAHSSFYQSPFDNAVVISHDGFSHGVGYHSGMVYYGTGNTVIALAPHHLAIGALYDAVATVLGFEVGGGAGKLMGLAPYGQPRFYNASFVHNWYSAQQQSGRSPVDLWIEHCRDMLVSEGYDRSALGDPSRITEPACADIAASTQKLFEETYLHTIAMAHRMVRRAGIGTHNLCLTGGTALNCPTNSRIFSETAFNDVFVEPSCGDDGLAMGAAFYVYHQALNQPRQTRTATAYRGPHNSALSIEDAVRTHAQGLLVEQLDEPHLRAAQDIAEDRIIAWFEGQSEIGPRALGHRSILANPSSAANWQRVNRLKTREHWRPFAPAVLESEAEAWFKDLPHPAPYMLFTGQVRSERLPAITHVDGSARVQTVNEDCGQFCELLKAVHVATGTPVLLNTSFNGPGQPIIETPQDAIEFLRGTELDALYLGPFRVSRSTAGSGPEE